MRNEVASSMNIKRGIRDDDGMSMDIPVMTKSLSAPPVNAMSDNLRGGLDSLNNRLRNIIQNLEEPSIGVPARAVEDAPQSLVRDLQDSVSSLESAHELVRTLESILFG